MRTPRIYNLIVDENNIDIIDKDEVLEESLSRLSAIECQLEIKTSCIQNGHIEL